MSELIPLPDGMTTEDLDNLDLHGLARQNPHKAMVFADFAMKHQVKNSREAWITQANILYYVKHSDLWKYHPDSFSSFFAWCQQPEIELPPSVVVDMLAVVHFAPALQEQASIDIFDVIREVGQSKIRQLIPVIRDAYKNNTLAEQVAPLIDEVKGSSFRQVLKMVNPGGNRTEWDPEAIYSENADGSYNLTLRNLDFDRLELAAGKLSVKRWFNPQGYRIDNPLNHPTGAGEGEFREESATV